MHYGVTSFAANAHSSGAGDAGPLVAAFVDVPAEQADGRPKVGRKMALAEGQRRRLTAQQIPSILYSTQAERRSHSLPFSSDLDAGILPQNANPGHGYSSITRLRPGDTK